MTVATRKRQQVITPEFTCGALIAATVTEKVIELVDEGGYYSVHLQTAPAHMVKIGTIHKFGTGWNAEHHATGARTPDGSRITSTFCGDNYPTRTGKHTRTFAICWLVARACGFAPTHCTYNLRYEGVSA
jgi:hypothetical protein